MTEDEIVGWYHQLNGHEFEQSLGYGEGQVSLSVLQSMRSRRVEPDLATKKQQIIRRKRKKKVVT